MNRAENVAQIMGDALTAAITSKEKDHAATMAAEAAQHTIAIAKARKDMREDMALTLRTQVQEKEEQIAKLRAMLSSKEQEHTGALSSLEEKHAQTFAAANMAKREAAEDAAVRTTSETAAAAALLAERDSSHQEEVASVRQECESVVHDLQGRVQVQVEAHETAMAVIREQHEHELTELPTVEYRKGFCLAQKQRERVGSVKRVGEKQ